MTMHDVPLIMNTAMASYVKAAAETAELCTEKWKVFMANMGNEAYKISTGIQFIS